MEPKDILEVISSPTGIYFGTTLAVALCKMRWNPPEVRGPRISLAGVALYS